jgi:hypothetical protein
MLHIFVGGIHPNAFFVKKPFVLCWLLRALFHVRKEKKRVANSNDRAVFRKK